MKNRLKFALWVGVFTFIVASCGSSTENNNEAVVDAADSTVVDKDAQPNTGCD